MSEANKLLDNGWAVLLFRDGLGSYTAIAHRDGTSADAARQAWADDDHEDCVFGGMNKYSGCGFNIAGALQSLTEKVLFNRLPERDKSHDAQP